MIRRTFIKSLLALPFIRKIKPSDELEYLCREFGVGEILHSSPSESFKCIYITFPEYLVHVPDSSPYHFRIVIDIYGYKLRLRWQFITAREKAKIYFDYLHKLSEKEKAEMRRDFWWNHVSVK